MILSKSLAAACFVAGIGIGLGAAPTATDPLSLTGRDWRAMAPASHDAYLAGFVAGAAAHQATRGSVTTGARAVGEVVKLKRGDQLAFPYGTNVYRSHLDDYYFYENRRRQMLIEVIVDFNSHLRER